MKRLSRKIGVATARAVVKGLKNSSHPNKKSTKSDESCAVILIVILGIICLIGLFWIGGGIR